MSGTNYYLLTALPPLGELGDAAPITPVELIEHVGESAAATAILEAIFLSDDLLQRESVLAGELDEPEPTVLTVEQVRDEAPLPPYLAPPEDVSGERPGVDRVMDAYFRHAARRARRTGCQFLGEWVRSEVGLRNALVRARARALNLDPQPYLVAVDLAENEEEFAAVVGQWSSAPDPFAGQRILDTARWRWIEEHQRWFSFADDELAAYAAKLMLIHRWHRIAQAEQEQ